MIITPGILIHERHRSAITPSGPASIAEPPARAASVVVSLGGVSRAEPPPVYDRAPPTVWLHPSDDAVTRSMAQRVAFDDVVSRLDGLGATLLTQYAADGSDIVQSVALKGLGVDRDADVGLTIVAASGARVVFRMQSHGDHLFVEANGTGTLGEKERAAVGALAQAFQAAVDGMTALPPKLDVVALTRVDPAVLASVDLAIDIGPPGGRPNVLGLQADTSSRRLTLDGPAGAISVAVDATAPAILGSATQRANAMGAWMAQIDAATARGHGDRALMAVFKDAFTQMHAVGASVSSSGKVPMSAMLSRATHALMSGLADFHASVTQARTAPNPLRADEYVAFTYGIGQSTDIEGDGRRDRSVSQVSSSHLLASFHSPLVPGGTLTLDLDPKSQNYYYTKIDDSAGTRADVVYREGRLVQATYARSASQSTLRQKYVMGRLVEETLAPTRRESHRDVLALLRSIEDDGKPASRRRDAERAGVLASVNQSIGLQANPSLL